MDPLNRTSSVITLSLIMQSEAAGMFHHPSSGKEGHAMLAASAARMQADQAQQGQQHQQPAALSVDHYASHGKSLLQSLLCKCIA